MDWTLCGDYFGWKECEDDEIEEPELIVDWCEQNNSQISTSNILL